MEAGKNSIWLDDLQKSTADPNISVTAVAEDVPTLTVMTIVGVTLVILVAIVAVFLLGVLIDCRQQRLIDEQMEEAKRLKNQRRANTHSQDDGLSIAYNMEEPEMSVPPAEALRDVP